MKINSRRLAAALLFATIFLSFQPASVSAQGERKRSSFGLPPAEALRQSGRVVRQRRSPNSVSRPGASSGLAAGGATSARSRRGRRAERESGGHKGSAWVGTGSGRRGGAKTQAGGGQFRVGPIVQSPVNPQGKTAAAPKTGAVISAPTKPRPIH